MGATGATGLLAERVALVTGGAHGLGAAIAYAFARAGAVGSVVDLETSACEAGWTALAADVADEGDVEKAVAETVRRFGRLDVVVANAGVVPPWSDTSSLDLAALDRTLAVNVRGVAATLKHGARAMTETGGSIVVMASMNAWHALPAQSAYTASKHAVLGLVRTAALDLGGHGIRVNAIGPGPVATEFSQVAERGSGKEQRPSPSFMHVPVEDVVRAALPAGHTAGIALLLTDGSVMMIDGAGPGWLRLTPDATGNYAKGTWTLTAPMSEERLFSRLRFCPAANSGFWAVNIPGHRLRELTVPPRKFTIRSLTRGQPRGRCPKPV